MQLAFLVLAAAARTGDNSPIQKVLALLSDLEKKVMLDGEIEQKQYEKFAEWCEDGAVKTQYVIKNGKMRMEDLSAVIEKATAASQNQDSEIKSLAKAVRINERDLKAATDIRNKEKADFDAADTDLGDTIDMLGRAIGIIAKSMKGGASFAQVAKSKDFAALASALSVVVKAHVFAEQDAKALESLVQGGDDDDFLARSAPDAAAYENHSGGILDTLEDLKDKAQAMRNDGQKAEMNAKHAFQLLAQSLNRQLKVDGKALDAAKAAKFAAEEAKAQATGDLGMTTKVVDEAVTSLKTLGQDCQQKAADHAASQKEKDAELAALKKAQALIGDSTGGAADRAYGLIETGSDSKRDAQVKVVEKLQALGKSSGDVVLSQLALRVQAAMDMSQADVFAKIRGMISEMIDKLVASAAEEADHKAWCDKETGETQEKIEDHQNEIEKLTSRLDKADAQVAQLTESIAESESSLATIAKEQAEMNSMRSEEKKAFKQTKSDYESGIEGLTMALQVLREYYATAGDETALIQQPDVDFHDKSTGAASGIIGLLEVAQADFSKLLADAEVEEATAQDEYDKQSHENAVGTAMKGADIKYEKKEVATLSKRVAEMKEDRTGVQAELDAVVEYYARVKPGCTTKPMTYEERKQRRESEIAGLKEALTILAAEEPENVSFLAMRSRHA